MKKLPNEGQCQEWNRCWTSVKNASVKCLKPLILGHSHSHSLMMIRGDLHAGRGQASTNAHVWINGPVQGSPGVYEARLFPT